MIAYSNCIMSIFFGNAYSISGYILDFALFFIIFRIFNILFHINYINRENRIIITIFRSIGLAIFILSYILVTSLYNNIFSGIFSFILGEGITALLFYVIFSKETEKSINIFKLKSFYSIVFLYIIYIGGIYFIKYFVYLSQLELFIFVGVSMILFPVFVGILNVLHEKDFDLLEKIITPIHILSKPVLFYIHLIKKITLKLHSKF